MYIIHRPQTNPWFNLAAEEYLLKEYDNDCFMLWRNEPSIVVGKHQNTFAEINPVFVEKHQIPVIRRITGGGTVFHDPGNVNFSFIANGEPGKMVDFQKFTDPIIHALNVMGVPARFEGKNDLKVNGFKISGNAEHVYKNRVLHHGTLLFDSKLDRLGEAIRVRDGLFEDKAVQSNRSKVANIIDFLDVKMDVVEFIETLEYEVKKFLKANDTSILSEDDLLAIKKLAEEKYKSWDWNYGYSPPFTYSRKIVFEGEPNEISIRIEKGLIKRINLKTLRPDWDELFSVIQNEKFDLKHLLSKLQHDLSSDKWNAKFLKDWLAMIIY